MDIDLLSKMVKELILDNDRVVLPGLGSFVAEIVPSTFSDKGYTINPPYRRLYFRSKPDEGDALVDFYARSNSIEKGVAERIIKDYIMELQSVLYSRKTVVFPGLGRLRATKENNVFFVADEELDIYPAGFGLEPISLKSHSETKEEVSAAVVGLKSILSDELVKEPVAEPEPILEPEPEVVPAVEPVVEPEPEVVPAVEPVVEPEPAAEPEPEVVPAVEPVADPEPVAEPEPEVVPAVEPVVEPEPEVVPKPVEEKEGRKSVWNIVLTVLVVMVAVVVIYMVVGRLFPEWIDQFLYTPEELEIIRK